MKHPEKWKETVNPYELPYEHFMLKEILGYPHAGNDVFHAIGIYEGRETEVYIKYAAQKGADIANEVRVIHTLNSDIAPRVIDYDKKNGSFAVMLAKSGERLSFILGDNSDMASLSYMFEYGECLAKLHRTKGCFPPVKDRRFFHIPDKHGFDENQLFVRRYLIENAPHTVNTCFCHGDFHYANILWENGHISAILDFELSGMGNREFDIAWALIVRPGQSFLMHESEISLFLDGYRSLCDCNTDFVQYYMILIYAYFYRIGKDIPEYTKYVSDVFQKFCL